MNGRFGISLLPGWLAISLASPCHAQYSPFQLTLENYSYSQPGSKGLVPGFQWLELKDQVGKGFSLTNTYVFYPGGNSLDETYLQYERGLSQIRLGRIHSGFGFVDWSNYWYNPIISLPLPRIMPLQDDLDMMRFDTGVEARTVVGNFEFIASFVDPTNGSYQLAPRNLGYSVGHVQTSFGPLIVGGSVLEKMVRAGPMSCSAYGLDFRWTASHLILRGEMIRSHGIDGWAGGYYVDAFYRPPKTTKTQLGFRFQSVDDSTGGITNAYVFGIRQILWPTLALTLNKGIGGGPGASWVGGWSLEVCTSYHF